MSKKDILNGRQLQKDIQTLLDIKCRRRKYRLKVSESKMDDDWTLVVINPTRAGVSAYDYAKILSDVEEELEARGYDQVLLLPTLPD